MNNFKKPSTITAIILFAYVLVIGGYILWWNQSAGGLVQSWYREYIDANGNLQGSGKWRLPIFTNDHSFDNRKGFPEFAFLFGSWIYVFSPVVSFIFIKNSFQEKNFRNKIFFFSSAIFALLILSAFFYLGIFRAVNPFH